MAKLNDIIGLVEDHPELSNFSGKKAKDQVKEVGIRLNVRLPNDYSAFLEKFGCGNFGSEEIYGITASHTGIPSVIWATENERGADNEFPSEFIVINYSGGEEIFCLDTSKLYENGICPVVAWPIGGGERDELEVVANSFTDFVYDIFKDEIESN